MRFHLNTCLRHAYSIHCIHAFKGGYRPLTRAKFARMVAAIQREES